VGRWVRGRRFAAPAQSSCPYYLRHTCATIFLMAGKHPKYLQELPGHASFTLDTCSYEIEGGWTRLFEALADTGVFGLDPGVRLHA
jgi:hypothetical protein